MKPRPYPPYENRGSLSWKREEYLYAQYDEDAFIEQCREQINRYGVLTMGSEQW